MGRKASIVVDFDGTCVLHRYPLIGEDCPHAVRVLKALSKKNYLILFTMRDDKSNKENYLAQAVQWFDARNIPLYGIQQNPSQWNWTKSIKPYGKLIIDDAAAGCPLIYPEDGSRAYVDWLEIEKICEQRKLL